MLTPTIHITEVVAIKKTIPRLKHGGNVLFESKTHRLDYHLLQLSGLNSCVNKCHLK